MSRWVYLTSKYTSKEVFDHPLNVAEPAQSRHIEEVLRQYCRNINHYHLLLIANNPNPIDTTFNCKGKS